MSRSRHVVCFPCLPVRIRHLRHLIASFLESEADELNACDAGQCAGVRMLLVEDDVAR